MAWSTPRTWASGELVTAGNMNTYISDNLSFLFSRPTTASTILGADVNVATWSGPPPPYSDGPSVSLVTGLWFVIGTVLIHKTNAISGWHAVKLWDGTTIYASLEHVFGTSTQDVQSFSLSAVVNLGSTTTVKLSVASTQTSVIKAAGNISTNMGTLTSVSGIRAVFLK